MFLYTSDSRPGIILPPRGGDIGQCLERFLVVLISWIEARGAAGHPTVCRGFVATAPLQSSGSKRQWWQV